MADYRDVVGVYWRHLSRYQWKFFTTVGLFAVLQGALLATPWFLRNFFDVLATEDTSTATVHVLVGILGFIALMWAISWICRRLIGFVSARTDAQVMADLYDTEFTYLLGHSHNFFISRFAGSLTHKVSKLVKSYQTIMDDVLGEFFPTFLFVLGAIIILYFRNHTLGLALAGWTVAFFAFQIWVARLRQPIRAARADGETRITATVADAIGNQSAIALFSGVAHERDLLARVVDAWRRIVVRSWDVDEYIWGAIGLFTITIQIGLLWGAIGFW
jgi:ATP-binding cassette subfamily B protein